MPVNSKLIIMRRLLSTIPASDTRFWYWEPEKKSMQVIRSSDPIDDSNCIGEIDIKDAYFGVHTDDIPRIKREFRKAVLNGHAYRVEYRMLNPSTNSYEWMWAKGWPHVEEIGGVKRTVYLSGIITAIADKKQTENNLIEARQAAESANNAKSLYLATMVHEIRTPLSGMLGMLDLIRSTTLDRDQTHYLEILQRSSEHLLKMANNILDFSKIEAGWLDLEEIEYDIETVIKESTNQFDLIAEKKGLAFYAVVDSNVPRRLIGDPDRIIQILINLLNNAFKFTNTGSVRVNVATQVQGKEETILYFKVQDSGIGIGEDLIQKIFSPYQQANSSIARHFGGSGLGLSICKMLAELMGGEIGLESKVGEGTTFWFTIKARKVHGVVEEDIPLLEKSIWYIGRDEQYAQALAADAVHKYLRIKHLAPEDIHSTGRVNQKTGNGEPDLVLVDTTQVVAKELVPLLDVICGCRFTDIKRVLLTPLVSRAELLSNYQNCAQLVKKTSAVHVVRNELRHIIDEVTS